MHPWRCRHSVNRCCRNRSPRSPTVCSSAMLCANHGCVKENSWLITVIYLLIGRAGYLIAEATTPEWRTNYREYTVLTEICPGDPARASVSMSISRWYGLPGRKGGIAVPARVSPLLRGPATNSHAASVAS